MRTRAEVFLDALDMDEPSYELLGIIRLNLEAMWIPIDADQWESASLTERSTLIRDLLRMMTSGDYRLQ